MPSKSKTSPAKTTPQPTPVKKPNSARKIIVLAILLVLAADIAALLIVSHNKQQAQKRQLEADKAAFAAVETEMAKTYNAVLKEAGGNPTEEEQFKNCSPIAHKYDDSDLSCGLAFELKYSETSLDDALKRADSIQNTLNAQRWLKEESELRIAANNSTDTLNRSFTKNYINRLNDINCDLYAEFKRDLENDADKAKFESRYIFRCSKREAVQIYPLAK